jgi:NOL1/NOP2/fmu family ribosome biogenesis protein
VQAFASGNLEVQLSGGITVYGSYVYASPENSPALDGLKVARPGWFLGTMRGDRFEPSHALAMGLKRGQDAQRHLSFAVDDGDLIRYLKGETLQIPEERIVRSRPSVQAKGYCLVCVEGYPLGWGKWLDGMLKNEYPPGWRWT